MAFLFCFLANKQVNKHQSCTIPVCMLWVQAYPYFRELENLCTVHCGCGVAHTFSRGNIISLHCLHCGCDYTHTTLKLQWKSMGVGTTMTHRQVYFLKHPHETHGCKDTRKVFCVSFKVTYGKA